MHLLQTLAFLLLVYHARSVPAPLRPQLKGRSFKVDRVRRADYVAHGPTALRNAYRKFGIVPTSFGLDLEDFEPINLKDTHPAGNQTDNEPEPERTGTVSATSVQSNAQFVSPVIIGGQKIIMTFDTGSSDFWVMNTAIPEAEQQGHTVFDPSKSPTFKVMQDAEFQIRYGDSSYAAGMVGTDTVNIGGATVENQAIGIPLEVSPSLLEDQASSGLVGLGFLSISTIEPKKQPTFFGNVVPTLDEPVLTASLKTDGVGEYEFGIIDTNKYKGKMANVTVDPSNGFWQFPSTEFAIGDGPRQTITQVPTAIADTGTSIIMASPEVVEAYYAEVKNSVFASDSGGYIYPCMSEMPNLSIAVGGTMVVVPGSMMTFSPVGTNTTTGESMCFGGIQSNQGVDVQVFGDVFLKTLFVVFDHRGPSLGIATPA
ncbi:Aspartic endopeptidase [Aspergillus sclerotialis]|uniref:Aspartic endopeptidase n=1 Tax=Aspergillus sclerotialis TaxID=2070753 RepID=A0A3A2ZN27_9EURO|nr:Aspartic endopeptidase [Aspergillus sclerotialis]